MGKDKEDYTRKVYIPMSFLALDDTPITFEGAVERSLVVNASETGVEFSIALVDDHSARHENGGADKLDLTNISGVLPDRQKPQNHVSRHEAGGADAVKIVNLTDYQETTVELGGDFDAGKKIKIVKIGSWVFISGEGLLSHANKSKPTSVIGVVPSAYRPLWNIENTYMLDPNFLASVTVRTSGTVIVEYFNYSGTEVSRTDTSEPLTIFYPGI